MAAGVSAPLTNLVSRGAKMIAEPFESRPAPKPITQHLPIPGGGISRTFTPAHTAEEVGQAAEFVGDIGGSYGVMRGLQALKAPLAKLLPTVKEKTGALNQTLSEATKAAEQTAETKIGALRTEQQARLAALERDALEAQKVQAVGQAKREAAIPPARANVIQRTQADIDAIKTDLSTQQARVGEAAARAGAPVAPKKNFNRLYEKLKADGAAIETAPINLNTAAFGIKGEGGFGTMRQSERNAAHINKVLTQADPLEIEEDVRSLVKRGLTQGAAVTPVDYGSIVKQVLSPATADNVTVKHLILTQKRLNESQGAAYAAGHKGLALQFDRLEEAVMKDIAAADKGIAARLKAADRAYSKKKSADWYTDGIQNAVDPTTGAWDRKRFTKWWDDFTDEKNGDKYLKRTLGDKYESTAALVKEMQQATEMKIEQVARTAIRNRAAASRAELSTVERGRKDLDLLAKEQGRQVSGTAPKESGLQTAKDARANISKDFAGKEKDVAVARDAEVKRLKDEVNEKVLKMTGRPYSDAIHRWYGPAMVVHGVVTANPVTLGGGLLTILTHKHIMTAMNSARGQSYLKRLIRSAPGSGEAIAAGNALHKLVKSDKGETEPESTDPTFPPAMEMKASGKVDSLLKKYGVIDAAPR